MSKNDPKNIGSNPHDPDPPPPPPPALVAVLDAIAAGATWEAGALRTTEGVHWLAVGTAGWTLVPDSAGYALARSTFNALVRAAVEKAPLVVFGQHLGLVPRASANGRLFAELVVVGPAALTPL